MDFFPPARPPTDANGNTSEFSAGTGLVLHAGTGRLAPAAGAMAVRHIRHCGCRRDEDVRGDQHWRAHQPVFPVEKTVNRCVAPGRASSKSFFCCHQAGAQLC